MYIQTFCNIVRPGLEEVGIYRISGSVVDINNAKAKIESGKTSSALSAANIPRQGLTICFSADISTFIIESCNDINLVTGLLKQWLRELPEPIITYDLYSRFIEAVGTCSLNFSLLSELASINRRISTLQLCQTTTTDCGRSRTWSRSCHRSNFALLKRIVEHLERYVPCIQGHSFHHLAS